MSQKVSLWLAAWRPCYRQHWMCGNVTLLGRLGPTDRRAVPEPAWVLLERMLRISQMRGAQSGGGAIQIGKGDAARQIIEKCSNAKRGDLASRVTAALTRAVRGCSSHGSSFLVQTHVRYATASVTTRHEAHPFRFVESRERGPRRVTRLVSGKPVVEVRPVETALTHNGDMDGMDWRGKLLGFSDLSCLLERILGVESTWNGDSPVLAAAIELYLTKGMWLESLRLAYHLTVAPAPPDLSAAAEGLSGDARRAAVRRAMAAYPVPTPADLSRWEAVAEEVFAGVLAAEAALPQSVTPRLRDRIATALRERALRAFDSKIPEARSLAFARAAVHAFFDNDLYVALRKLEPALDGTFGCVVTSTLEPGALVAMSRGQPLSLGFERKSGRVGVVSERAALKVLALDGSPAFAERLDLDLCRGEIARVDVTNDRTPVQLTLYGISDGRESTAAELVTTGRLVPIVDNPYVPELPPEAKDRVEADFDALGPLLRRIRDDWADPQSKNRASADAFVAKLFGDRVRVVVLGITNDLWLAQNFAQNLTTLFPGVEARAVSSNEILSNPGAVRLEPSTIVLAISQSGQDFPTLGALVLLSQRAPEAARDSFFVLTGEVDSLLGQAVGQSYAKEAPFGSRIFTNLSGFRPSEAAIATVNSTHLTLAELLLHAASQALDTTRYLRPPIETTIDRRELAALRARRDATVDGNAEQIVRTGGANAGIGDALGREARRWSWHVSEGIVAFALVVLVLQLNLQLGLGLLPSSLLAFASSSKIAAILGTQANVLFYAFLGPLLVWTIRALQGRPGFHRQGTRELLIGDVRYVHQIGWLLAKKLFSLSYGFASIKPYSADCQDELVMTHEPLRGTLVLVGVPDGRRTHLRTRAAAALMAAKQFNNSRSIGGGGAEIVTISHAPAGSGQGIGKHVCLPGVAVPELGPAGDSLLDGLFDSWERLMALQTFLDRLSHAVSTLGPFRYDRSRTKDQVFAPTTAAPVSAAAIYQLLSRKSERYEGTADVSLPFEVNGSGFRRSAPPQRTTAWRPEVVQRELERLEAEARASAAPAPPKDDAPN